MRRGGRRARMTGELPELWVKSRIWVWKAREKKVVGYLPGKLV
ncbi:hypothetical protein ACFRKD_34875 [Streptomyces niveus]